MKHISSSSVLQKDSDLLPLLEFSQVVNSANDLKFILGTVLLTLMGKLLLSKGVVMVRTNGKKFSIESAKGISANFLNTEVRIPRLPKNPQVLRGTKNASLSILSSAGITKLFPIISHNAVIGFFGLGERLGRKPIQASKKKFVETLINISAAAIEKALSFAEVKNINRVLDGKIQELKTLFELSKEYGGIIERERLLKLFSLTLMGHVGTNRYAICLKEGDSVYSKITPALFDEHKLLVFDNVTAPTRVTDLPAKKIFDPIREHCRREHITSFVPLQVQNEVRGMLCLGERLRGGDYSQSDLEFIYSLGNLTVMSLENIRLFNETVEKKQLESELLIARDIQQRLLPRALPVVQDFDIAAVNVPSKQVGGDYYDVIPLENGTIVLAIGDVSGKGTPASLLMANVQAIIRTLVHFNLSLPMQTSRVNHLICDNTSSEKFITFFWGILDPSSKTFRYVNAGHNPPFVLRRDGRVERLTEGGLILGIMKEPTPYLEGSVVLQPGDAIIMFTDGVSEAMNPQGVDYTEERLELFLLGLTKGTASDILHAIQREITAHAAGAVQSDDITLLVVKAER